MVEGMNTNNEAATVAADTRSALKTMVEKLDNRPRGNAGYVTTLPELQSILSELTPLVSVAILESHSPIDQAGEISVDVRLSFTLERALL